MWSTSVPGKLHLMEDWGRSRGARDCSHCPMALSITACLTLAQPGGSFRLLLLSHGSYCSHRAMAQLNFEPLRHYGSLAFKRYRG